MADWGSAEFSKITYKEGWGVNDGVFLVNVKLEFTTGEHVGKINLRALTKSENGWFISGVPIFSSYHRIPSFLKQ